MAPPNKKGRVDIIGGSGGSSPEIKYAEKLAEQFHLTYKGNVNIPSDDPVSIAIYGMGDDQEEVKDRMAAIPKDWTMHFTNAEGTDIYIPQDIPDNFNVTAEQFLNTLDDLPQFLKDGSPDKIVLSTSTLSLGEYNGLSDRLTVSGEKVTNGTGPDNYTHVITHEMAHAFDNHADSGEKYQIIEGSKNWYSRDLSESKPWKDAVAQEGYSSKYGELMGKIGRKGYGENFADAVANYHAQYGERNETPKGDLNAKEWKATYPLQAALIEKLAQGDYKMKK